MRIQCKNCGKEYRVDENRLTSAGIRVKCRNCSAVLLIRRKEEDKTPMETEAALSIGGSVEDGPTAEPAGESVTSAENPPIPEPEFEPKIEPGPEPGFEFAGSREDELNQERGVDREGEPSSDLEAESPFRPEAGLEPDLEPEIPAGAAVEPEPESPFAHGPESTWEPDSEPEPEPRAEQGFEAAPPPEGDQEEPSSGYRFCISCGNKLDQIYHAGQRPVCSRCESTVGKGAVRKRAGTSLGKKAFLTAFVLLILLIAALMGYHLATGFNPFEAPSSDSYEEAAPAPENEEGLTETKEF